MSRLMPGPIRAMAARAYPWQPWLWDRPFRFLSRRLLVEALNKWVPTLLDTQWALPLDPGLRIVFPLRDVHGHLIFTHGVTEYATAHMLEQLIERDWVCVDVGANRGEYTLTMAKRADLGLTYAFEPVDTLFARLEANVRLNRLPNVVVTNAAVHQYDGRCAFYVNRHNVRTGLSSLSPSTYFAEQGLEEQTVPCVTLDSALSGASRVDLVKIDVEGHEINVLQGTQHILNTFHPVVVFEFGFPLAPVTTEASDYLISCGYNLYCMLYGPQDGAALLRPTDLSPGTLARYHSPYEPINLIAIPPQRLATVAHLLPAE
jgi:FkbM family methyltransferase